MRIICNQTKVILWGMTSLEFEVFEDAEGVLFGVGGEEEEEGVFAG